MYGNPQRSATNIDGSHSLPQVKRRLLEIFRDRRDPSYLIASRTGTLGCKANPFLLERMHHVFRKHPQLRRANLVNCPLKEAHVYGMLLIQFMADAQKRVVYVGNQIHHKRIQRWVTPLRFIQVPQHDAFLQVQRVVRELTDLCTKYQDLVVFVAAGFAANVIVDEMWKRFKTKHTFMDVGSTLDHWFAYRSRALYYRVMQPYLQRIKTAKTPTEALRRLARWVPALRRYFPSRKSAETSRKED